MSVKLDHGEDELAESHEINVTPFIDVMLVLLIIFMVAAPLATVDVPVELPTSTVASGAATMKMMSRTSITSMNGVTLISWTSLSWSSPWSRRTLMVSLGGNRTPAIARTLVKSSAIEIAADDPQDFGGSIGMPPATSPEE